MMLESKVRLLLNIYYSLHYILKTARPTLSRNVRYTRNPGRYKRRRWKEKETSEKLYYYEETSSNVDWYRK